MTENERKLASGLLQVRDAIIHGAPGIEDTVWMDSGPVSETMVDRIGAVLVSAGAGACLPAADGYRGAVPLFEMVFGGERSFVTKITAAGGLNGLMQSVEFGDTVLDTGLVLRAMTRKDKIEIANLSDEISADV